MNWQLHSIFGNLLVTLTGMNKIVVCDLYSAVCNSELMAKGNCTSHCIEMFDCI